MTAEKVVGCLLERDGPDPSARVGDVGVPAADGILASHRSPNGNATLSILSRSATRIRRSARSSSSPFARSTCTARISCGARARNASWARHVRARERVIGPDVGRDPGCASSCCIPRVYRPRDIDGREHQNGTSPLTTSAHCRRRGCGCRVHW